MMIPTTLNHSSAPTSNRGVKGFGTQLLLSASLFCAAAPLRAEWNLHAIDTTGKHTGKTSLALSESGAIHLLAYHGGQYEHRYWRQSGNSSLQRHGLIFTNGYGDLAFDGEGKLHAVLVAGVREKNSPKDLLHLVLEADTTIATLIDTTSAHYHWIPDLVADREGKMHVTAYLQQYAPSDPPRENDEARDLAFASLQESGKWSWSNLDNSSDEVSKHSAIAFDNDNRAHIAYLNVSKGNMLYQHQTDTGWVAGEVKNAAGDKFYGFYIQMLMDDDGKPHLVFMRYGAGDKLYLHHAYPDTGSVWTIDSLDAGDTYSDNSAIGFTRVEDGFAVAYRDSDKQLSLARINSENEVTLEKIDDSENTGFAASLAVDGENRLYVTYLDSDGFVRLATENSDLSLAVQPGKLKGTPRSGAKARRHGSLIELKLNLASSADVQAEVKDAKGRTVGIPLSTRNLGAGSHTLLLSSPSGKTPQWLWVKVNGQVLSALEIN
jgi:hypothetical protein